MKTYTSDTSLTNNFRSIFLIGANTATYKFALAKSLLELNNQTFVSLDDLSSIFAKHLIEHIQTGKRQIQEIGRAHV